MCDVLIDMGVLKSALKRFGFYAFGVFQDPMVIWLSPFLCGQFFSRQRVYNSHWWCVTAVFLFFLVLLVIFLLSLQGPWSLDVLHARRHACSAVVKLCKEFGGLLVVGVFHHGVRDLTIFLWYHIWQWVARFFAPYILFFLVSYPCMFHSISSSCFCYYQSIFFCPKYLYWIICALSQSPEVFAIKKNCRQSKSFELTKVSHL